jgi:mono/diheme cytochrome c family protein
MRLRVALVLVLGALALVVAACGGAEETAPVPDTVEGTITETPTEPATTEAATTESTTTESTTTESTTTETSGGGGGDAAAGKEIFAAQGCGSCHTLAAAGSSGNIGPNLDEAMPDFDLVVQRVTNGMGVMPSFKDQLSEQQINDVAAFVSSSAGQS